MARLFNDKVDISSAWMNGKKKARLRNMILFEANIAIRCRNCGELYDQSLLQRDNEYTRFKCGCGGDIEIDDESLILAEFARQLRENKPDLYKQLVNEIFGEDEGK
jgi:hypothetical protein